MIAPMIARQMKQVDEAEQEEMKRVVAVFRRAEG
jgi:hypothetical protein